MYEKSFIIAQSIVIAPKHLTNQSIAHERVPFHCEGDADSCGARKRSGMHHVLLLGEEWYVYKIL